MRVRDGVLFNSESLDTHAPYVVVASAGIIISLNPFAQSFNLSMNAAALSIA